MHNKILLLTEGFRLAYTSTKHRIKKPEKYSGTTEEICRKIVEDCFDKKKRYFRVSPNNFRQFYARDFGMCCESLINLGYKEEVRETLIYAMDIYLKKGKITTQITPFGAPADFPCHTPESASYMLNSLILLNDKKLIYKYKIFFKYLAEQIYLHDIDRETGLLRKDKRFSSIKDHSLRKSDCYNNCFLGLFEKNLRNIGVKTNLSKYNYKKEIKKHFLKKDKTGYFFLEDLSGKAIFASDANIFPFWTRLFDGQKKEEGKILKGIIKKIRSKKLDCPWPLKYTTKEDSPRKMHAANILSPGYEKDTLWIHLGLCYMHAIRNTEGKLLCKYLKLYKKIIDTHKTFYEVYDSDGKIFSRPLYRSDEGMLWCSIFLEMYITSKQQK